MSGAGRVLVLAYACEPARGSESEVGWRWMLAGARAGYPLTIVTRANNRPAIEQEIEESPELAGVEFVYHEAPRMFLDLKRVFGSSRLYYLAWQLSLLPKLRRMVSAGGFRLAHQLTYVSARFGSVAALCGLPFVWGPIGGLGRVPRAMWPVLRLGGVVEEVARVVQERMLWMDPLWRACVRRADRVVVADAETSSRMPRRLRERSRVLPAIGVDCVGTGASSGSAAERHVPLFVCAGQLVPRKGVGLFLEALGRMRDVDWRAEIYGAGRDAERLRRQAALLGIDGRVRFAGVVSRPDLLGRVAVCDAFVALSLRESGGMALLEAASLGRAVVFVDTGAPAELFASVEAGKVSPRSPGSVVEQAETWLRRFAVSRHDAARAGAAARDAARRVTWEAKEDALRWLYG